MSAGALVTASPPFRTSTTGRILMDGKIIRE